MKSVLIFLALTIGCLTFVVTKATELSAVTFPEEVHTELSFGNEFDISYLGFSPGGEPVVTVSQGDLASNCMTNEVFVTRRKHAYCQGGELFFMADLEIPVPESRWFYDWNLQLDEEGFYHQARQSRSYEGTWILVAFATFGIIAFGSLSVGTFNGRRIPA